MFDRLANELGVPLSFVKSLANGASHEYKAYEIAKRSGGTRTIHHPSRRLKAVQRWLLREFLEKLPVHHSAAAYVRGRSIKQNAEAHARSRFLLRMDFLNFFPSLRSADLVNYMATHALLFTDLTAEDRLMLSKFLFRNGILTIGAPTSPALSNALCFDLDAQLANLCDAHKVAYTRYADDLFFSTSVPEVLKHIESEVERIVGGLKVPAQLAINRAKTRHASKKRLRRVTGITLGSDNEIHLGRYRKREIRSLIHKFDTMHDEQRASLRGKISFAVGIEPRFLNDLILKYGIARIEQVRTS